MEERKKKSTGIFGGKTSVRMSLQSETLYPIELKVSISLSYNCPGFVAFVAPTVQVLAFEAHVSPGFVAFVAQQSRLLSLVSAPSSGSWLYLKQITVEAHISCIRQQFRLLAFSTAHNIPCSYLL